jgi:pimeloyl-ACP methyl ester carboxylesterase
VTRKSWILQVDALQSRYRVLVPDLPGHGVLEDKPFDLDAAVDCLHEMVQSETRGRTLIAGVSLGGHVATLFGSRYPELVAGLVISGASGSMQGPAGLWMRLVGRVLLTFFREDRLKANLEKSLRKKWPEPVAEAQIADGLFPHGAAVSFTQIPRYDYRRLISRVQAPVLVLNGEMDRPNRKGEAAFAAAAPDGRVEVISGAGHACNIENAADYNHKLMQFAEEIRWDR